MLSICRYPALGQLTRPNMGAFVLPNFICGFKRSICCTLMSVWAMIMMSAMFGLLSINSIAFIDDIPAKHQHSDTEQSFFQHQDEAYERAASNCLIALVLYVITFVVSLYHWIVYTKQSSK